jgi:hypothetical protein
MCKTLVNNGNEVQVFFWDFFRTHQMDQQVRSQRRTYWYHKPFIEEVPTFLGKA